MYWKAVPRWWSICKAMDQAAGLEIAESLILCRHQAYKTLIKSIAVFVHSSNRVEVARRKFTDNGINRGRYDMALIYHSYK
jgi:hypothetical protein